jgi:hypothetical protein
MCCGVSSKEGAIICVDHIKPRNTHPELALNPDNLQVLCDVCNQGKGAWSTTDFRDDKLGELRQVESRIMRMPKIIELNHDQIML